MDVSDFNGFWAGSMTLVVPTGWSVKIAFSNRAKSHRHSLMLTKPYSLSEMPEMPKRARRGVGRSHHSSGRH